MGGNALKIETRRLSKADYEQIESEVCAKLAALNRRLTPIRAYANKADFGDLDILISKPKPPRQAIIAFLTNELGSREIAFNSDNISFEYQNFQVDLIFVEPQEFEIAEIYFSFNDLGNLMGRIAHKFGLKHGWQGLFYPVNNDTGNAIGDILISRDARKIFEFLDFDYDRYLNGFADLTDIFEFVISSKYFNAKIFDYAELNTINRTRNRKRATYRKFVEYLGEKQIAKAYEFNPAKTVYLPMIAKNFSEAHLLEELAQIRQTQAFKHELSLKFNGNLIMELIPSLSGKALGEFITKFKSQFEDFDDWLSQADARLVKAHIRQFAQSEDKCNYSE